MTRDKTGFCSKDILAHMDRRLELAALTDLIEKTVRIVNGRPSDDNPHARQTLVELMDDHRLLVGDATDDEDNQLSRPFPLEDTAQEGVHRLLEFAPVQVLDDFLQLGVVLRVNVLHALEAFDHLLRERLHVIRREQLRLLALLAAKFDYLLDDLLGRRREDGGYCHVAKGHETHDDTSREQRHYGMTKLTLTFCGLNPRDLSRILHNPLTSLLE